MKAYHTLIKLMCALQRVSQGCHTHLPVNDTLKDSLQSLWNAYKNPISFIITKELAGLKGHLFIRHYFVSEGHRVHSDTHTGRFSSTFLGCDVEVSDSHCVPYSQAQHSVQ